MLREKVKLTYNDYFNLPNEKRYELIEGELYMVPAPDFFSPDRITKLRVCAVEFCKKEDTWGGSSCPCRCCTY